MNKEALKLLERVNQTLIAWGKVKKEYKISIDGGEGRELEESLLRIFTTVRDLGGAKGTKKEVKNE